MLCYLVFIFKKDIPPTTFEGYSSSSGPSKKMREEEIKNKAYHQKFVEKCTQTDQAQPTSDFLFREGLEMMKSFQDSVLTELRDLSDKVTSLERKLANTNKSTVGCSEQQVVPSSINSDDFKMIDEIICLDETNSSQPMVLFQSTPQPEPTQPIQPQPMFFQTPLEFTPGSLPGGGINEEILNKQAAKDMFELVIQHFDATVLLHSNLKGVRGLNKLDEIPVSLIRTSTRQKYQIINEQRWRDIEVKVSIHLRNHRQKLLKQIKKQK